MEVQVALGELKELFRAHRFGNWPSWERSGFSPLFTEPDLLKAREMAAEAVRDMQKKQSLDDGGYFYLQNELTERLLVYNVLLQAIERGDGTVTLEQDDLDWVRERTSNCVLMDYGGYLGELLEQLTGGAKVRMPEGIRGFRF